MICGACLRPLNRYLPFGDDGEPTGEVIYRHPLDDEAAHDPEPQPRDEHYEAQIDNRCDFCNDTEPVWRYRAPGMQLLVLGDDNDIVQEQHFSELWDACTDCGKAIEHRNLAGLVRRSKVALGDACDALDADYLERQHQAFFLVLEPGRVRLPKQHR